MDQLSPLGDLLKLNLLKLKERGISCKYHGIRFDPIHGDSVNIPFQK